MASITIRNLDEGIKARLRQQAARHGCSMEEEARQILRRSVIPEEETGSLVQRIHQRFARFDLDSLPIPERRTARQPPEWPES